MRHSRGCWPEGWTTIAREKGYTESNRKSGSNRTVMLLNSVQQSTRDGLESDTVAPDYIDSDQKDLGFAMSELPEHVAKNRAYWDDLAQQYVEAGESAWAQEEPTWGGRPRVRAVPSHEFSGR